MTTSTKSKSRKSNNSETISATEANLIEQVVSPVQAEQEAQEAQEEAASYQAEQAAQEAKNGPHVITEASADAEENLEAQEEADALSANAPLAEVIKQRCESEEERKKALEKASAAIVKKITTEVKAAEGTYSVAWVRVGLMSLDFVRVKMAAGHGYGTATDILKAQLVLIAPPSYAANVDQVIRAGCAWRDYCETKGIEGDKDRDAVARAIPWRTWFGVLSSLMQGSKNEKGETNFAFLTHAKDDCVGLIESTIKEGWKYDDVLEKAGAIRRANAQLEADTADQIRRDAEEKAKGVKIEQQRLLNEKAEAAKKEQAAKDNAARLEKESADAVKASEEATAAAAKEDADEDDEAAAQEALAIAEESKLAVQKAKEEEENQKQEAARLTKEAKEAEDKRRALNRTAEAAAKVVEHATNQIVKIDDASNKRTARLNGNGSGKGEKKEDDGKGDNLITFARKANPKDLASALWTMMKSSQMPYNVLAELLSLLNDSKEGGTVFKDDKMAQNVITAAVVAMEAASKPKS